MKKLLSFLFVLFALGSVYAAEPDSLLLVENSFRNPTFNKDNCTCKGIPLYGRVKVITSSADFDVKIIEHSADLDVKVLEYTAGRCGEWQFVEHAPDFTIRLVEHAPDFEIRMVEHAPDFTIRLVEHAPDFEIRMVEHAPGIP
jgi:hypothetical protein